MTKHKIDVLGNIVKVTSKVLRSGDKETRLEISVVGPSTAKANQFADLEPADQVKVSFDPDYNFNGQNRDNTKE